MRGATIGLRQNDVPIAIDSSANLTSPLILLQATNVETSHLIIEIAEDPKNGASFEREDGASRDLVVSVSGL